tara:strand:- start:1143 stop:2030 length:888 start_codon:yes stop_codon:yes gene_type:complete
MKKDQIFILKDRGIVYISGEDSKDFLQNIVTNDLNKVSNTLSAFSSLLTPQGKYLFDFIIVKHKHGYFLDCEINQIDDLINKLEMYKLNSKIEILNLSNEFQVAAISNEKFLTLDNTKNELGFTTNYRDDPFLIDPRNINLGARVIINLEKLYMSIKKLGLQLEEPEKYYDFSHKLGIAQINTKDLQEKLFGLECNFEELNGIDFKKGCYVGQENTARMKMKNKIRKRLIPIDTKENIKSGSEISFKNESIGKVLIGGQYPFALIRFDNIDKDYMGKDFSCDGLKIKLLKPTWLN